MVSSYRNIVVLGFGNIGQALSPLLRKRFASEHILVIDDRMEQEQEAIAELYAMESLKFRINQKNFVQVLSRYVGRRTLVVNLATSICSRDLIVWTQSIGAFYLDTCIDPWEYQDGVVDSSENTNYEMREAILDLIRRQEVGGLVPTATAVVAHGANPGFVSILVKQGLLKMQQELLHRMDIPETQSQWAQLAQALGVRIIQISEKDTQDTSVAMQPGEFVNTWSVDGYVAESLQPAELGWGTHEEAGPMSASIGRHISGCQAAVFLKHMGVRCEVKSWAPGAGEFVGNLISHNEAISLAHYLTLGTESGPVYRPTVYYAYCPCAQASLSLNLLDSGNRNRILKSRVLKDEIESGIDELGVLIISDKLPSLWIGSQLSIDRARELAPYNNATSLQVVGSVMAALEWMLLNPAFGVTESERLDHVFLYQHTRAYWEPLVFHYCSWHPDASDKSWTIDKYLSIRVSDGDIDTSTLSGNLSVESARAVQH